MNIYIVKEEKEKDYIFKHEIKWLLFFSFSIREHLNKISFLYLLSTKVLKSNFRLFLLGLLLFDKEMKIIHSTVGEERTMSLKFNSLFSNNLSWLNLNVSAIVIQLYVHLSYLLLSTENEHNGSSNGKIFSLPWHDSIKCRLSCAWSIYKRIEENKKMRDLGSLVFKTRSTKWSFTNVIREDSLPCLLIITGQGGSTSFLNNP